MTPEAQRIAIAEACGWTVLWHEGDPFKYFCKPGDHTGVCCGQHLLKEEVFREFFKLGDCGPRYVVPDYLNDLNAMHEAEKMIVKSLWDDHTDYLEQVCWCCHGWEAMGTDDRRKIITATAAQRAEAFLRTLNLWKDDV